MTSARYPGDLPFESFTEIQAREAIESAETIEKFVLKQGDLGNLKAESSEEHNDESSEKN